MKKWFAYGGIAASVILVAFGIGAIAIGVTGLNTVRDEIAAQNITATDDAAELTDGRLQPGAGDQDRRAGEGVRGHHGAPHTRVHRGQAVRRDGPLPDGGRHGHERRGARGKGRRTVGPSRTGSATCG